METAEFNINLKSTKIKQKTTKKNVLPFPCSCGNWDVIFQCSAEKNKDFPFHVSHAFRIAGYKHRSYVSTPREWFKIKVKWMHRLRVLRILSVNKHNSYGKDSTTKFPSPCKEFASLQNLRVLDHLIPFNWICQSSSKYCFIQDLKTCHLGFKVFLKMLSCSFLTIGTYFKKTQIKQFYFVIKLNPSK